MPERLRLSRGAEASEGEKPYSTGRDRAGTKGWKPNDSTYESSETFLARGGITKGDLLRYYAEVSAYLLPHLAGRAMVMKRYPNGAAGKFFSRNARRSPAQWIEVCAIEHAAAGLIDFPIVRDLSSLLWLINLGCIDLNPWYARCDDVQRPDYLHFDLDPVPGAEFAQVRETALVVHEALDALKIPTWRRQPDRGAFMCMCRLFADRPKSRCGPLQSAWPRAWRNCIPN